MEMGVRLLGEGCGPTPLGVSNPRLSPPQDGGGCVVFVFVFVLVDADVRTTTDGMVAMTAVWVHSNGTMPTIATMAHMFIEAIAAVPTPTPHLAIRPADALAAASTHTPSCAMGVPATVANRLVGGPSGPKTIVIPPNSNAAILLTPPPAAHTALTPAIPPHPCSISTIHHVWVRAPPMACVGLHAAAQSVRTGAVGAVEVARDSANGAREEGADDGRRSDADGSRPGRRLDCGRGWRARWGRNVRRACRPGSYIYHGPSPNTSLHLIGCGCSCGVRRRSRPPNCPTLPQRRERLRMRQNCMQVH